MSALVPANLMLCYDGSLEGFLSCVFDAYALHSYPLDICEGSLVTLRLGQQLREVQTDVPHARRVRDGLARRAGARAWRQVRTAFLSDAEGREEVLFAFIVKAMEEGERVLSDLACPCVAQTRALVVSVMNERERIFQFLRFEELEGGVFFARIEPQAKLMPILMGHFVERFSTQPFMIYDERHGVVGIWNGKKTSLVKVDSLEAPAKTEDERRYQRLWKTFYDSVSNEQRYNPDLRRSLMPQRFWKNLPEMRAAVEGRSELS